MPLRKLEYRWSLNASGIGAGVKAAACDELEFVGGFGGNFLLVTLDASFEIVKLGSAGASAEDEEAEGKGLLKAAVVEVGTDAGRMVAVGDTGIGWKPSIRVVGLADEMIGLSKMD